ncbi:hypothetical protein AB0E59_16035 [Lentzea sp. NPDC034063]|uniref:hypothetical protein n=1 Tax=unclassified Lentzea TaxID=2643253 RepID=UPI0033E7DAF5
MIQIDVFPFHRNAKWAEHAERRLHGRLPPDDGGTTPDETVVKPVEFTVLA